jgi:Fe-S cluster assembly protein SufD
MVTMLVEGSDAQVHGGVAISSGIVKAEGRLLEENIVLGKKIKIHTLPQLDVRSNDVAASHGARIETLDPKKLFYLQSKGIPAQEAKRLMIEGYVESMFANLETGDQRPEIRDQIDEMKRGVMERLLG